MDGAPEWLWRGDEWQRRKQILFEDDNQNDNGKNEEIGKGASRSNKSLL
jgi:hypothetical protein